MCDTLFLLLIPAAWPSYAYQHSASYPPTSVRWHTRAPITKHLASLSSDADGYLHTGDDDEAESRKVEIMRSLSDFNAFNIDDNYKPPENSHSCTDHPNLDTECYLSSPDSEFGTSNFYLNNELRDRIDAIAEEKRNAALFQTREQTAWADWDSGIVSDKSRIGDGVRKENKNYAFESTLIPPTKSKRAPGVKENNVDGVKALLAMALALVSQMSLNIYVYNNILSKSDL
uniref:Uncharacterized protein n=1 Tax=Corethron hystrix TaxID=216773 RepID=A0A7S1BP43_9STRA|mmetsp:Transcript_360/g.770  ORF Transcript_360/g.770 Transcript_360/m.770 type:complete len:230 (+) Transcript_360:112-801(+)|eukprot:CAMPEP_0113323838 /NCGR_PEP_ID=MMETSP0010_2-20120614/16602_1 /TAXON_ID=216773 ORGANISM="Corethron hystrix, Strain 308" /NCGR_SAMPLE_ID=MMETSP0010_2 /ASSEMBLY_ACC=CAM_ASM_000155 /LENGTH=229 /DNA_ID=CAMNT_0000182931 /DNA_START=33 /DNA_END=722 /DNA_ORIENTATION=- /assembly_acc=CAM_ASM_000155